MRRILALTLVIGILAVLSLLGFQLFDTVTHVNEPRITQDRVRKVQAEFASLVAQDAKSFRVLWVELDAGTTVFQYQSSASLDKVLAATKLYEVTSRRGDYAEIYGGDDDEWLRYGQVWKLGNRIVVALSGKEYLLTDSDQQEKIRRAIDEGGTS